MACGGWQLTVDTDRTVVALYKFIKEHASIPFKLRKPASTPKSKSSSDAEGSQKSSIKNVKDELWATGNFAVDSNTKEGKRNGTEIILLI